MSKNYMAQSHKLFTRYGKNPILTRENWSYPVNSVFNAGAAIVEDEYLLLVRVEDHRGLSHLTVARSTDGVENWRIDPEPTLLPSPATHPEELWGIEDPRITRMEELNCWAVLYTAYSASGPLVALATTKDFKNFDRMGSVMPPEDKDAALFPVKFGNRFAMLHRPVATFHDVGAHIWISFSPDLKHWGDHEVIMPARRGAWWDANKIGLSPPPLKTSAGWLILYHGVKNTANGCLYRLGLALLDLADPRRVLRRSAEWIFGPQEVYETRGDVGDVVFPCGWVLKSDEIRLYYGGADTCIALATGSLREILDFLSQCPDSQDPIC
jgi:predicted GH43/DUF377 family glycosyl hydrolase